MILSVQGLDFNYPGNTVLKDVSFSLKRGECLAVLGKNGAGKSTLLKCINRILSFKRGTVFIDNRNMQKMSQVELAREIGHVSQYNQYSRTTVFDSVLIGRKPHIKWDAVQSDLDIVNNAINMLELDEYSLRYIDELSGGEFQKVVIARALAQEPSVLLFDEPTSNLDLKNQIEVVSIIKKVVREKGISAIVTMHDLNLALRFADKFMLMSDGMVFAHGGIEIMTPENIEYVYSVPVNVEMLKGSPIVVPI